jgi:hypothetical protein
MPKNFLIKVTPPAQVNNDAIVEQFFTYNPELLGITSVSFTFGLGTPKTRAFPREIYYYQENNQHKFQLYKDRRKVILNYLKNNNLQLASQADLRTNQSTVNAFFKNILYQHILEKIQPFLNARDSEYTNKLDANTESIKKTIEAQVNPRYIEVDVPPDGNCFYHALASGIIYNILTNKISEDSETAKKLQEYFFNQIASFFPDLQFKPTSSLKDTCIQLLKIFNYADTEPTSDDEWIKTTNWLKLLSVASSILRKTMASTSTPHKEMIGNDDIESLQKNCQKKRRKNRSGASQEITVNQDNYFTIVSQDRVWAGRPEIEVLANTLSLCIAPTEQSGLLRAGKAEDPYIQIYCHNDHYYLELSNEKPHTQTAKTLSEAIKSQQEKPLLPAELLLEILQIELVKIKAIITDLQDNRHYSKDYSVIQKTATLITILKEKEQRLQQLVNDKSKEPKQSEVDQIKTDCVNAIRITLNDPLVNHHRKIGCGLRAFLDALAAPVYAATLSLSHKIIRIFPGWSKFTLFSLENTKSYNTLNNAADCLEKASDSLQKRRGKS